MTHTNPFRDPSNPKKANHCLSKGSYCSAPQFEQGISDGREIVLEDLRQKCIFQISNTKGEDYNPGAYFNYMSKFFNNCVNGTSPDFNYDCSMKTMKQINFNPEKVDDCIKKSFNVKSITEDTLEKDNNILERDTQYKKQYNVKLVPHLYINNSTMEGSWSAENLFKAICASFINKPFTCSVYFFAEIESDSTDLSWGAVLIVIILIVVLNAVIIYVCKKYIMKRIHERIEGIGAADLDGKINHVLSSYMALREQK